MNSIFSLNDVSKTFEITRGITRKKVGEIRAVDQVTFDVNKGEIFGIIGETGSGKSTLAKMLLLLEKPDSGRILFYDRDILSFDKHEVSEYRRKVQTVFQDPSSSLNPRQRVKTIVEMPMKIHHVHSGPNAAELLKLVNLDESYAFRYPHTLSGGERQRVAIARALALQPEVIVLDEPTSALDVSVQAKVIALLRELKRKFDMTYVFISHDLSLVANFCDRLLVMYNGKMCELGSTRSIFRNPLHPYTELLLSSAPVVSKSEKEVKPAGIPAISDPAHSRYTSGCVFRARCWMKEAVCETDVPFKESSSEHGVACHFK